MRGRALNQINTDIIKYINNDNPDDNIKEQIENFGKFKKRIRIIFGLTNKKALAESIIQTLRQTILASDYSTIFRYYTAKTNQNNNTQISIYKKGLKDNVQDKLIKYKIRARCWNHRNYPVDLTIYGHKSPIAAELLPHCLRCLARKTR